jgi:hypothetical protein
MSPHGINEQEEGTKIIKVQKKKEKRTWMIFLAFFFARRFQTKRKSKIRR